MKKRLVICFLVGCLALLKAMPASAATFVIDPQHSSLNVTNSFATDFGGGPYVGAATSPGSLEARLGGSLEVALTGSSLEILAGSSIIPLEEGSYLPGIPEEPDFTANLVTPGPASYATTYPGVSLLGGGPLLTATRGLEFTFVDDAPRTLSAGAVGAAVPEVGLIAGEGHLNLGNPAISPIGTLGLTGTAVSSGAGTLAGSGVGSTLTLPIEFTISVGSLISTATTYTGTIVATQVPEPGTLSLVALASVSMLGLRRKNRN